MEKIRVCHVVCGLVSGGVEQMIINYSAHMDREKYRFDVIYQHEADEACRKKFEDLGFELYEIPAKAKNPIGNILKTYTTLRRNKYDIVHSHMTLMNFIPLFCSWLCGIHVRISHSHNVDWRKKGLLKRLFEGVCKFLTQMSATDFIACGKDAGIYLYGDRDVKVFDNAVDISKFQYNKAIREEYRLNLNLDQKLVIGHIGRFTEQKNHIFLIEIFKKLHEKNPNTTLLLIGGGELEAEIRKKVHQLGLNDAILFIGTVEETSSFLQAIDVFVLPSLWEGFPVTLIEAQAAGLPCIVANTISPAVKITKTLEFMSLDNSQNDWANKVLSKAKGKLSRERFAKDVSEAGYDILDRVKELDKLYTSCLR